MATRIALLCIALLNMKARNTGRKQPHAALKSTAGDGMRAFYYEDAYLCIIDGQKQQTYFLTVTFMVTLPAVVAVLVTSRYLFTAAFQDQKAFYQRVYEYFSERTWNYYITFVITVMYTITGCPSPSSAWLQSVTGSKLDHNPPGDPLLRRLVRPQQLLHQVHRLPLYEPQFRQGLREVCDLNGESHRGYALCGRGCAPEASLRAARTPRWGSQPKGQEVGTLPVSWRPLWGRSAGLTCTVRTAVDRQVFSMSPVTSCWLQMLIHKDMKMSFLVSTLT
ncbi:uncharacterized protein LOC143276032 [Babylonia areolata]|uniref:uncharacterized protein LOC143276032 n=1 Tax=Babylonia areolata TaxID=304850 RepID=UPI003FD18250